MKDDEWDEWAKTQTVTQTVLFRERTNSILRLKIPPMSLFALSSWVTQYYPGWIIDE